MSPCVYSGNTLVIEATGTVKEAIEDGAYVDLEVKYGYIRLISTRADLCKEIKNVDLECPIEKGKVSIIKSVDLPKEIPPVRTTLTPPPKAFFVRGTRKVWAANERLLTLWFRAGTPSRRMFTARTTSTSPA